MWFELENERSDILGSGSDIQSICRVQTLEEALEAYKNNKCNRITRYNHINGKLVSSVYDPYTKRFE